MSSSVPFLISAPADTLGAWVLVRDERTVYDEWNPVAQIDAAGQVVQRHLWGTDLSGSMQGSGGVGGLLGTWDNGATTRDGSEPGDGVARVWVCAYDGNGNVNAAIAATVVGGGAGGNGGGAGTVRVSRYDYDAFGKTLATWGDGTVAEANRYQFSTKPEDGTGLLYYGYRYLDTRLGRWVSRDPIGESGGWNLYGFVRNDGIKGLDVVGLDVIIHKNEGGGSQPVDDGFGIAPQLSRWIKGKYDTTPGWRFDVYSEASRAHTVEDILGTVNKLANKKYCKIFIFIQAHGYVENLDSGNDDSKFYSPRQIDLGSHYITLSTDVQTGSLQSRIKLTDPDRVITDIHSCFWVPHHPNKKLKDPASWKQLVPSPPENNDKLDYNRTFYCPIGYGSSHSRWKKILEKHIGHVIDEAKRPCKAAIAIFSGRPSGTKSD